MPVPVCRWEEHLWAFVIQITEANEANFAALWQNFVQNFWQTRNLKFPGIPDRELKTVPVPGNYEFPVGNSRWPCLRCISLFRLASFHIIHVNSSICKGFISLISVKESVWERHGIDSVENVILSEIFIVRQHTDAWYWYSKSVCPSVRYVLVPDENGLTYRHSFFTIQ